MKRVFIVILCILVFLFCLAIGIFSGDLFPSSPKPASAPSNPLPPTNPPNIAVVTPIAGNNVQQNLVLVQIDNLTAPDYHLEAVWLLLFTPNYPDITLLLLYPSPKEPYKNLADQFKLTQDGKLDAIFTDSLHNFKFKYQGFILIDEDGLRQWVDWLKGIDIEGNLQNGDTVRNYIPKPWDDFDHSLTHQKTVAAGLCNKISLLPLDVNWTPLLVNLLPDHMSTDMTIKDIILVWKNIMAQKEKPRCKILSP